MTAAFPQRRIFLASITLEHTSSSLIKTMDICLIRKRSTQHAETHQRHILFIIVFFNPSVVMLGNPRGTDNNYSEKPALVVDADNLKARNMEKQDPTDAFLQETEI